MGGNRPEHVEPATIRLFQANAIRDGISYLPQEGRTNGARVLRREF